LELGLYNTWAGAAAGRLGDHRDPLFGVSRGDGYGGNVSQQDDRTNSTRPSRLDTEHSGGTWVGNQQQEDVLTSSTTPATGP